MNTSTETISEKIQNIKTAQLEEILKVSGSAAITKNEYGVTIVDDNDGASSLIFKSLNKDKYDNVELQKAIDTIVKELKPNIPVPNLDLVPKPLYDEQVATNEDLRKKVADLTIQNQDLTQQVAALKAEIQVEINKRLVIEQTNDVLANQLNILAKTISDFAMQISTAVQKSIDESILDAEAIAIQVEADKINLELKRLDPKAADYDTKKLDLDTKLLAIATKQKVTAAAPKAV